ncbi:MAG: hypothetical protein AB7N76_30625 [Planctomycetota bacterium]
MSADHCSGDPSTLERRERGTALIVTTIVLMMLMALAATIVNTSVMRSNVSVEETMTVQLQMEAESGLAAKFDHILENNSSSSIILQNMDLTIASTGHTVEVRSSDEGNSVYKIQARAYGPTGIDGLRPAVEVEAYIGAAVHPAFYKALYVGNKFGLPVPLRLGPVYNLTSTFTFEEDNNGNNWYKTTKLKESSLGIDLNNDGDLNDNPRIDSVYGSSYPDWGSSQGNMVKVGSSYYKIDLNQDGSYGTYTQTITNAPELASPTGSESQDSSWETTHKDDADYVVGNSYVNGDVEMKAYTTVFGDVDATGTIQGEVVPNQGYTMTAGAEPITPPDLQAQNYESIADQIITASGQHGAFKAALSGSDYGNLGSASGMDNTVIHLGPNSGSGHTIGFSSSDNGKLFLVKGDLWLHHLDNKDVQLPNTDLVITIVVEGNLYIGDDLDYYPGRNQGILFLAKGKGDDPNTPEREDESFYDANKNFKYDVGETIINDDGNGTYEGPKEGQGNIYFGDAKYGTGGVTDGFMYAENNAYLMDPTTASDPPSSFADKDKIYGVNGFLSAGGVLDLGSRTLGNDYFNYKVVYDERIENGSLSFKGIPSAGGGGSNFGIVAWKMRKFRG